MGWYRVGLELLSGSLRVGRCLEGVRGPYLKPHGLV